MKKYWNRLIFTLFVTAAFTAVSCDDDDEGGKIQENWYANYGYITYKMYPDTNIVEPMKATHNAYGVELFAINNDFDKAFTLNLKRAVEQDTKFVLGIDGSSLEEGSVLFPAENLYFYTGIYSDETADAKPANEVVMPAGEKSLEVKVHIKDFSFADEYRDAVKFYVPIVIESTDNAEVKLTSNRNSVIYSIDKSAYEKNSISLMANDGSHSMTVNAGSKNDVPSDWGSIDVKLGYKAVQDTKVKIAVDNEGIEASKQIPASALSFKLGGEVISGNEFTIKAGESKAQLSVELTDQSFIVGSEYSTSLKIVSVSDEEMELDEAPLKINLVIVSVSFTKPTSGTRQEDRSNYVLYSANDKQFNKGWQASLFNGNTMDYISQMGYRGFDIAVDMGKEQTVTGLEWHTYGDWEMYAIMNYDAIYVGDSAQGPWTKVHDLTTETAFPKVAGPWYVSFGAVKTRYIRIHILESYNFGACFMSELYFYVK